jgi:hypothetical protein
VSHRGCATCDRRNRSASSESFEHLSPDCLLAEGSVCLRRYARVGVAKELRNGLEPHVLIEKVAAKDAAKPVWRQTLNRGPLAYSANDSLDRLLPHWTAGDSLLDAPLTISAVADVRGTEEVAIWPVEALSLDVGNPPPDP